MKQDTDPSAGESNWGLGLLWSLITLPFQWLWSKLTGRSGS